MVDTMKDVFGVSRLAIVYDDNAFGDMFRNFLTAAAKASGLNVTHSVPVKPGAADLRPQLRPLLEPGSHEVVVLATTGVTPGTAIKQAKEIGVTARYWIGEQFTWVPDALKAAGASADGAIATTPLFDRTASPKARKFAEDYEKRFGVAPDALASRAYDAISAMALAAKNAKSCDGASVRSELVKLTRFEGVSGVLDFSRRIAEGALAWGQVQNGKVIGIQPAQVKK
jgi:branched-chain amino acid transport system substrate-binding protein